MVSHFKNHQNLDPYIPRLFELADWEPTGYHGLLEELVALFIGHFLKPEGRAVDIGAHKARHMDRMVERAGPKGRVDGFEPIPHLFEALKTRYSTPEFAHVGVHRCALGREEGTAQFTHFRRFEGFSGLKRRTTPFDDEEGMREEIEVDVRRLDAILPERNRPLDLIKLDIEGGEFYALQGARDILLKDRPVLVMENSGQMAANVYGYTMDAWHGFFEDIGYRIFSPGGILMDRKNWGKVPHCSEIFAFPTERSDEADILPKLVEKIIEDAYFRRSSAPEEGPGPGASPATKTKMDTTWKNLLLKGVKGLRAAFRFRARKTPR